MAGTLLAQRREPGRAARIARCAQVTGKSGSGQAALIRVRVTLARLAQNSNV
jgi:hypothetical protein